MTRNTKVFAPPRHLQNSFLCPCRIVKISHVKKSQNSLFGLLPVFKHIHVLRQRRMLKNICSTQITWTKAHLRPALPEVPAPTRTYAEHVVPVHDNMFADAGCVQLCLMNCQQLRSAFTLACCWVSISFGPGRASNVWLKICSCSTRCSWSSHWQGPMKNVRGLWTHRSSKAFAQCSSLSLQDWPKANTVNIQCLCYMFTEASHIITWTNHTSCTTTELLKPTALVWCPQASS